MYTLPSGLLNSPHLDSAAARQFRHGFRWLNFREHELERDFRQHHRQSVRLTVCIHLWLAIVLLAIFLIIDQRILDREQTLPLILMRVVALGTLLVCTMVVSRPALSKHYHRFVQWLSPLFGLCVVINEFIDQPFGVSFFPTIVLTVVGLYLLVGMLFVPALCAGVFVLVSYSAGAWRLDTPLPELIYNSAVLVFTNIVGATACYMLERLHRTNFLETRLLAEMANRDGLTGIYNRRAFDEHLQRIWQLAIRDDVPVALLLIDIDHFKAYNDHYGHQAGDECLKQVAYLLNGIARRPLDFTARYGGEEFAVVLYNTHRSYVEELTVLIQDELRQLNLAHAASVVAKYLTASIGAACVTPHLARTPAGWVQLADQALYVAKDSGRDRCIIMDKEYAELATGNYDRIRKADKEQVS